MISASLEQALTREADEKGFAFRPVDVDPLQWLLGQPLGERVLHQGPKGAPVFAGSGVADRLTLAAPSTLLQVESALMEKQRRLDPEHPGWVGGVRFNPEQNASDEWRGFGAAHFILPRRVVFSLGGQTYFGITQKNPKQDPRPDAGGRFVPQEAPFEKVVAEAVEKLEPGHLEKVVMATCKDFDISIDVKSVLLRLREQEQKATLFWLELGTFGFFGATPERLYKRVKTRVDVDALAGTAALGEEAGQRLLADDKERREHDWVKRYVVEKLQEIARVDADEAPHLFTLSRLQHLRTRVRASLHEERSLLSVLHPTPAVCGTPTDVARGCIDALEGFDRGFYAGAFGRVYATGEDFHVALRCALYGPKVLRVFAGAGIVRGSLPAREAVEVARKTSALLGAIQGVL